MGQVPSVFTQPAGPVRATNATLNAMGWARSNLTSVWFEWGTNNTYGNLTAPVSIGSGTRVVRVSQPIFELNPGEVYYYRAAASNSFGVSYGAEGQLTTGMRIQNWGSFSYGLPRTPAGLTNIVGVAAGHGHCLAIKDDGTVAGWLAGTPVALVPDVGQATVPAGLSNVVAVAGGYSHSLAIKEDGTVAAWGAYIGNGPLTVPASATNVIAVAGGDSHSIALRSDGKVVAWGDNSSGQTSVPFNLSNVVAIAAGSRHNLVLKADGKCVVWGSDGDGTPAPPGSLSNVVAVSTEVWHEMALKSDGTVFCWGYNGDGQTNVPAGLSNVVAIAAGYRQSTALRNDGTLATWGSTPFVASVPPGLSNVVAVAGGDYHCVGLSPVNLPPRPMTAGAYGEMNQDLVIGLSGWDPNGDALNFRVKAVPTNGALYQYTSTQRGVQITATDTPVVDNASRVIYAPETGAAGAPVASFSFVANDGELDSTNKTVSITVIPKALINSVTYGATPARATITFDGVTNASYHVLAAPSPQPVFWTYIGVATQSVTSGTFSFTDPAVTNYASRFYRLISP